LLIFSYFCKRAEANTKNSVDYSDKGVSIWYFTIYTRQLQALA